MYNIVLSAYITEKAYNFDVPSDPHTQFETKNVNNLGLVRLFKYKRRKNNEIFFYKNQLKNRKK